MKKFLSVLGTIVRFGAPIATPILNAFAPTIALPITGIMTAVANTVLTVEATMGEGAGANKMEMVLRIVQFTLAPVIQSIESTTGAKLVDQQLFLKSIQGLAESIVGILNSFQHPEVAAAPTVKAA